MVARGVMCMTSDNQAPRGSSLIGAERQRFPPGELVCGTSWLIELGSRFQSERMCFRYREFTV